MYTTHFVIITFYKNQLSRKQNSPVLFLPAIAKSWTMDFTATKLYLSWSNAQSMARPTRLFFRASARPTNTARVEPTVAARRIMPWHSVVARDWLATAAAVTTDADVAYISKYTQESLVGVQVQWDYFFQGFGKNWFFSPRGGEFEQNFSTEFSVVFWVTAEAYVTEPRLTLYSSFRTSNHLWLCHMGALISW